MRFQNGKLNVADASTPEAFNEHWKAFVNRDQTLGPEPGVRERWHAGRTTYAVWAFRVDMPLVLQRVKDIQAALRPIARPTSISELHITVWVAGFPCEITSWDDDVAFADLESQRKVVESSQLTAPRLMVAGACAFLSCAVLEVHDSHGDLARLRAHLSQPLDEVRFANFNAHITIGQFGDPQPTAPLVDVLKTYRHLDGIEITPRTLELVFFDARKPGVTLETQDAVRLGPPG